MPTTARKKRGECPVCFAVTTGYVQTDFNYPGSTALQVRREYMPCAHRISFTEEIE